MFLFALKATRYGWFSNGFSAVALAAVLAPLLVLYGLKLGIVTALLDQLREDPNMRRIGISGYKPLTEQDIQAIRSIPETGFAVGAPRSIAARVEMRRDANAHDVVTADWLPTGDGDPLLVKRDITADEGGAILSEPLAEKLRVRRGDRVTAAVYRNSQSEIYEFDLAVADILPRSLLAGERALVSATVLNRIAAFSDGFAVPEAGIEGQSPEGRIDLYDSVRLYARSIDDVSILEREMSATYGFRASSEAASIHWVRELERVMNGVFIIIAAAGGLGYVISLWATIAGSVRSSRGQLSLLRLLGVRKSRLWLFPLIQVFAISTVGLLLAFCFSMAAGFVMNSLYLPDMFDGQIFRIRGVDILNTVLITYVVALLVARWQFGFLKRISPTEALADNL